MGDVPLDYLRYHDGFEPISMHRSSDRRFLAIVYQRR